MKNELLGNVILFSQSVTPVTMKPGSLYLTMTDLSVFSMPTLMVALRTRTFLTV